ncbi:MAG TPA: hypothetical protein ENK44_05845 [Caldithrix abyssi]|uniref:TonB-dependent receptor plug domain-containing protein n=1 Tax=Caldithrix abyssi TaxID=187145 RepID=A0A7V4U063_CALAY|nr:hypothetical protein [Caldithrix abyssi]
MDIFIKILFFILTFLSASFAGSIRGMVYGDSKSNPLAGVNISILNAYKGTTSDEKGLFILTGLEFGKQYKIQFSYIGYADTILFVEQAKDNPTPLEIILKSVPLRMKGIVVSEERESNRALNIQRLNPESIKNMPSAVEQDVVRALTYLPGVLQYNDLKGDITLRGSPPYQTQFLIDGMEIYYPWHMFSVFGVFNLDAVGSVHSYNAGFPARYGGRSGGVIDITTSAFSAKKDLKINLSLASISAYYKQLHGKWGVMLSARKTYFDILSNFIYLIPFGFVDANLKLNYFISKTWNIEINGYANNDFFTIPPDQFTGNEKFDFGRFFKTFVRGEDNWGNLALGLKLKYAKNNIFGQLRLYRTTYYMDISDFVDNLLVDYTVNPALGIRFNENIFLTGGMQYKNIHQNYRWGYAGSSDMKDIYPALAYPFRINASQDLYTGYFDFDIKAGNLLLQPGLRLTSYQNNWYHEERFSVRYFLSERTQLYGHAGRYVQFGFAPFQNMEFTIGTPLLFMKRPSLTNHLSVGIEKQLNPVINSRLDVYYKSVADLPENKGDFRYDVKTYQADIAGLDLFILKEKGYLTWQLSYSFLKTQVNDVNHSYPLDWDIAHNISFLSGIMVGKGWYFNMGFFFHSGLPYTPVTAAYYGITERDYYFNKQLVYGSYNSERLPNYLRFDFAVRKLYRFDTFDMFLKVQVINAFYRDNVTRIDWEEYYWNASRFSAKGTDNDGVKLGAPIIPSVGLEFIFR